MRKLAILTLLVLGLSGCSFASDSYQPGIKGVRDVPHADNYIDSSGNVHSH
jgi:hypothetical protein